MNKEIKKTKRNSSIELLRILMMMQIIFLHISDYGEYTNFARSTGGATELIYWILWLNSRCPVYVFVVIMGYFLSTSKPEFKINRILKCYLPMYFYAIIIPLMCMIVRPGVLDKAQIMRSFFPLLSRTWYFMTLYLLVLILSPFINMVIQKLDRKHYFILIGICFFLFSIWQPLSALEPFDKIISIKKIFFTQQGKSLYDFIYMYLLGGFLRKHHIFKKHEDASDTSIWQKPWPYLIGFIGLGLLNVLLVYIYPNDSIVSIVGYNDNPLAVLQCICIFRTFEKMDLSKYEKIGTVINYISAGNLGIYMIHEHPIIRPFIWHKILHMDNPDFYSSKIYLLKFVVIILLVYSVCWIIDWFRRMAFTFIQKKAQKDR